MGEEVRKAAWSRFEIGADRGKKNYEFLTCIIVGNVKRDLKITSSFPRYIQVCLVFFVLFQ